MIIRGQEVDVNIQEELDRFSWRNGKEKGSEFVCCSPFRDEKHPSFSINLESGLWIDFGSDSDEWKKGSFPRLLAFLEDVSQEEAEDLLLEAYGILLDQDDDRELSIDLSDKPEPRIFTRDELKPYLFRSPAYLAGRGISLEVQKQFVTGYDKEKKAVAFFWRDAFTGKVVTVKFRSTRGKQFYYIYQGQQVKDHLFGLYDVIKAGHTKIYLVESEIDCLYMWSNGFPGIALGGSHLSAAQKTLLIRSGVEEICICTDNDKAGRRIREQVKIELGGLFSLQDLELPVYAKDVNDLKPDQLRAAVERVQDVTISFIA
jgi:DNA primase